MNKIQPVHEFVHNHRAFSEAIAKLTGRGIGSPRIHYRPRELRGARNSTATYRKNTTLRKTLEATKWYFLLKKRRPWVLMEEDQDSNHPLTEKD